MSRFESFNEFQQERKNELQIEGNNRQKKSHPPMNKTGFVSKKRNETGIRAYLFGNGYSSYQKIKLYVLAATFFLFFILMALLFLPIPFGHIELNGNKDVTMENVIFEGNIEEPVNTLQISTATVKDRLSKDLRIEEVQIVRKFPGTIVINITERKHVAAIQTEYGYAILDKDAFVIKTDTSIKSGDYIMITGKRLGNVLLGDRIEETDVARALTFINNLSDAGAQSFSEINIGNPENFITYTRDGVSVRLGNTNDLEKQASLAENMVNDVKSRNLSVEYLDANMANPFIKLKK